MSTSSDQTILVAGATGNQGKQVTINLLKSGWTVRALTRTAGSKKADELNAMGAEVVEGDMGKPESIERYFEDIYGVYSVQNFMTGGIEGEISQGKNMADLALKHKISHFVYGSAGVPSDRDTGLPHFDCKRIVEDHIKKLGIPATVYSPGPFMELMTEKEFFPPAGTWGVMDKVLGRNISIPWISVEDIGAIVATIFDAKDKYKGQVFSIISDQKSLGECREIYKNITGKYPKRIPMPVWLFKRVVSSELVDMWEWMIDYFDDYDLSGDIAATRDVYPEAQGVEAWLTKKLA